MSRYNTINTFYEKGIQAGDYTGVKPILAYLITTNDAIQDAQTTRWSFINVFSIILIPKALDYTLQTFKVAGRIDNVPAGDAETVIQIVDKDGKEIAKNVLTGNIKKGGVQFAAFFGLVKFDTPGRYYMHAYFNDKRLTDSNRYFFDVVKEDGFIS